jgi:predicted O-linked N-acetylglucosamine transferase (SPINDLY family)
VPKPDEMTKKLQGLGGIWRSIVGISDQQLADQVRMDGVDILIDLSGFTEGHRLGTFVLKPAPIQCSWLGYPNTTGLSQIEYRITDEIADPPGMTEHLYTEKLIRLPRTFLCYVPGTDSPPIQPPDGPITFCCFNNLAKVSETVVSIWADILKALPEARLLLKSAILADFSVCRMVWSRFKEHGIEPDRIGTLGFTATKQEHLELYSSCHIALDTYPYHGTTTTCEALWMGVPVISLSGASHVSRVGTTILNAAGVPELSADSRDEYVKCAVELALSPGRIANYRHSLRSRMQSSALMDAPGFVSDLEEAFKVMLKR